ncbi:MAG: hypothetical protein ABL995_20405, partial [Bryobacteraceae bacterium]
MKRALLVFSSCVVLSCLFLDGTLSAQKKKKPNKKDLEPPTQVLELTPDPPDAVTADTARLTFQVSALSAKGLLTQQVKDALKSLAKENRGTQLVKIRAFVAGSGDLRRVATIVADEFTDQKKMLPVVSTIQVGALPMVGAQVLLEGISLDRRPANPNGLAFFAGVTAPGPGEAVAELKKSADAARVGSADVLRVTCFLSSLDGMEAARSAVASAFPMAATTIVQTQRQSIEPFGACEGTGRLSTAPAAPVTLTERTALINAPKIVLTTSKLVFKEEDSDVRLAFQRLNKAMESSMTSGKDAIWQSTYSLTRPRAAQIAKLSDEFVDPNRRPVGTSLLFEGLPSNDATAAVEWIVVG